MLFIMNVYHGSGTAIPTQSPLVGTPAITKAATSSSVHYPRIVSSYEGTAQDLLTNTTLHISLTQVQQKSENIEGNFIGMHMNGSFTGVLDPFRHIFFTVTAAAGQPSYFFEGAIRADNNLVGDYCTIDAQGQCNGNYGVWSLSPVT